MLFLYFLENAVIIAATALTLPEFLQVSAIILALELSRIPGAFLVTLIGQAVVDEKLMPFGLSIVRRSPQASRTTQLFAKCLKDLHNPTS